MDASPHHSATSLSALDPDPDGGRSGHVDELDVGVHLVELSRR